MTAVLTARATWPSERSSVWCSRMNSLARVITGGSELSCCTTTWLLTIERCCAKIDSIFTIASYCFGSTTRVWK